jgi:hypothetical protein
MNVCQCRGRQDRRSFHSEGLVFANLWVFSSISGNLLASYLLCRTKMVNQTYEPGWDPAPLPPRQA